MSTPNAKAALGADLLKHKYYTDLDLDSSDIPLQENSLPDDVQQKVKIGEIPTLRILQKLQNDKGEEPRDENDKNPKPFASKTNKTEIMQQHDFTEIDAHAKILQPKSNEDVAEFATRLFKACKVNLDFVRAAFCFVAEVKVENMNLDETENIVNDENGETATTPAATEFYKKVKGIREENQQSLVFHQLMQQTNVPCELIIGKKKAAGYEEGKRVTGNGNWFAVYVDGEWRFVDPFWGSTSVVGFEKSTFAEILSDGTVRKGKDSAGKTAYEMDENFFLTDPVKLIKTHLPNSKEWQLLVRPISESDFEKMVSGDPGTELIPVSHPWNVIVGRPGQIRIEFLTDGKQEQLLNKRDFIHKSFLNEEAESIIKQRYRQDKHLSKPIWKKGNICMFIYRPPIMAKYKLLFANSIKYILHCPKGMENCYIPSGDQTLQEFGIRDVDSGIESDCDGEVESQNGEVKLKLTDTKGLLQRNLSAIAYSCDDSKIQENRTYAWCDSGRGSMCDLKEESNVTKVENNFTFLTPDPGQYAIVIHATDDSNSQQKPLCQFLIDSKKEIRDNHWPMPNFDSIGGFGVKSQFADKVIPIIDWGSYFVWEHTEDLEMKYNLLESLELAADVVYVDTDGLHRVLNGFTLVNCGAKKATIRTRFPQAGNYILRVQVRTPGYSDWNLFANYFIRAVHLDIDGTACQLPEAGPGWTDTGSRFLEIKRPTKRVLPRNDDGKTHARDIKFEIAGKGYLFKRVYVEVNDQADQDLTIEPANGIIKGEITNGNRKEGAKVRVIAVEREGEMEVERELLSYRFESKQDNNIVNEGKQKANIIRDKRKEQEDKRNTKSKEYCDDIEGISDLGMSTSGNVFTAWDIDKLKDKNQVSSDEHFTMRAALLLLGCDKTQTDTWKKCKPHLDKLLDLKRYFISSNANARDLATECLQLLKEVKKPKDMMPIFVRKVFEWAQTEAKEIRKKTATVNVDEDNILE